VVINPGGSTSVTDGTNPLVVTIGTTVDFGPGRITVDPLGGTVVTWDGGKVVVSPTATTVNYGPGNITVDVKGGKTLVDYGFSSVVVGLGPGATVSSDDVETVISLINQLFPVP
jgi:hypothetical protein